jgi:hypothetical protein
VPSRDVAASAIYENKRVAERFDDYAKRRRDGLRIRHVGLNDEGRLAAQLPHDRSGLLQMRKAPSCERNARARFRERDGASAPDPAAGPGDPHDASFNRPHGVSPLLAGATACHPDRRKDKAQSAHAGSLQPAARCLNRDRYIAIARYEDDWHVGPIGNALLHI